MLCYICYAQLQLSWTADCVESVQTCTQLPPTFYISPLWCIWVVNMHKTRSLLLLFIVTVAGYSLNSWNVYWAIACVLNLTSLFSCLFWLHYANMWTGRTVASSLPLLVCLFSERKRMRKGGLFSGPWAPGMLPYTGRETTFFKGSVKKLALSR